MRDPEELFEELDEIEDECLEITSTALTELRTRWQSAVDDINSSDELEGELTLVFRARSTEVGLHLLSSLHKLGDSNEAQLFPATLIDLAPSREMKELVRACERDVPNFLRLYQAKREIYIDGGSSARAKLKEVKKSSEEVALKKSAQAVLDLPQPINSPPALFSLNGFGVGMYGSRDRVGSTVIKTHSICMLFIPVMPLSAYRVEAAEDGYYFLSKDKLSMFARGYRALSLLAIVGLIAFASISSYLNNPKRRFDQAMDAAQEMSASADRETLIVRYETIVSDFGTSVSAKQLKTAASALVPLYLADVPDPFTPDSLTKAELALARFNKLSRVAKSGKPSRLLSESMIAWAKGLDGPEMDQRVASLTMLGRASALDLGEGEAQNTVSKAYKTQRMALAGTMAKSRPLDGLELYLEMDAFGLKPAGEVLLAMNLSQFLSAKWQRAKWKSKLKVADATHKAIEEREVLAMALEKSNAALLAAADESVLSDLVSAGEASQEIRVALAEMKLGKGESKLAVEILQAIGSHGEMTISAQQLLSQCYSESGQVEDADALLDSYLSFRLGRFQKASASYNERANGLVDQLYSDARSGVMPSSIENELNALSDEDAQAQRFGEWVNEQLEANRGVAQLRASYEAYSDVVPMVLQLGMVKMALASKASGEERDAILAEAEHSFLAIATEASGAPQYHLNLGEVYYRLGKVAEGDKEFKSLLDKNDSELTLMVSQTYRGLGLTKRAKEAAEAVWQLKTQPFEGQAAQLMVLLSPELDDKEIWLKRGDPKSENIQIGLLNVDAERAKQEGRDKDADKIFAKIVKRYLAQNTMGGLNNAALANMSRYSLTGKVERLDSARSDMEKALSQNPNEPIVTNNLAALAEQHGGLEILASFVKVEVLRLQSSDTHSVLGYLLQGPIRELVLEKVQKNSSIRRSRSLAKRLQILSPQSEYGWWSEAGWMKWLEDAQGLETLFSRIQTVLFDDSEAEEERERYISGARDEDLLENSKIGIAGLELQLSEARATKHDPTIATLLLLMGHALANRAHIDQNIESAQKSLKYFRESVKRWPELGGQDDVLRALFVVAIFKAIDGDAELEKFWRQEFRTYGVAHSFLGERFENVRVKLVHALERQSEFGLAVSMAQKNAKLDPSLLQWVIGKVSGNAKLVELSAGVLKRPHTKTYRQIEQHLSPNSKSAKRGLAVFGE